MIQSKPSEPSPSPASPSSGGAAARASQPPPAGAERLVVRGVSKRFGPTQALLDVSCTFVAGEVHALMGENGAGKSTLGKAIAGLHKPDAGQIILEGLELPPGDVHEAFGRGVRIVHQELAQCPNLSVAENLCLHDLPTRGGLLDKRSMRERAARLLRRLDPGINVDAPLGDLAPGRRQIVQIAAALEDRPGSGAPPKVIIFDEPTSSLSVAEADRLMAIVRELAAGGLTCLYVSHRMGEIFACCDRITVLRDGKFVATSRIRDIDEATLVGQMIGRTLDPGAGKRQRPANGAASSLSAAAPPAPPGSGSSESDALKQAAGVSTPHAARPSAPTALEVSELNSPGRLSEIRLQVRQGEIVGIGGLVGSGRSELLDAIFGLDKGASGRVSVYGRELRGRDPREAIAAGLGYVPEDRRLQGLFFQLGVDENIIAPDMPAVARFGLRRIGAEHAQVDARLRRFQVKTASRRSLPGELSGGNQQKLLIARWLREKTRVLLLDEPTRGIDVGTKTEIYRLVWAAADEGLAVLLVSSEMPELLALSDRILVMCDGEVTGELQGAQMTQENILRLATVKHGLAHAATAAAGR